MTDRHAPQPDPACALAHGDQPAEAGTRTLVAVFAAPVGHYLVHFAADLGFRTVLVEPDPVRRAGAPPAGRLAAELPAGRLAAELPAGRLAAELPAGRLAADLDPSFLGPDADVVVTDHDRPELGAVLRDALAGTTRWIGVIGSVRHTAPHLAALRALGVGEEDIARVHRPVGLNIGSRTPAEIALATLAGLVADRNGRPGGFAW